MSQETTNIVAVVTFPGLQPVYVGAWDDPQRQLREQIGHALNPDSTKDKDNRPFRQLIYDLSDGGAIDPREKLKILTLERVPGTQKPERKAYWVRHLREVGYPLAAVLEPWNTGRNDIEEAA